MHAQIDPANADHQDKSSTGCNHTYPPGKARDMLPDEKGESAIQAERSHGMSTGEAVSANFNNAINGWASSLKHQLDHGVQQSRTGKHAGQKEQLASVAQKGIENEHDNNGNDNHLKFTANPGEELHELSHARRFHALNPVDQHSIKAVNLIIADGECGADKSEEA